METVKPISDLDPQTLSVLERVFGRQLDNAAQVVLVLREVDVKSAPSATVSASDVPVWCNVLEGLSDDELAEFNAALELPVVLAHPAT